MPEPTLLLESPNHLEFNAELISIIRAAPLPNLDHKPQCKHTAGRVNDWLQVNRLSDSLQAAALWLLAGELDKSHVVSQANNTVDGSFWHGIMHRREGDFWNSGYWMKKVGQHPVPIELANLHSEYKNPLVFIDEIESCLKEGNDNKERLIAIQWTEWQLLFAHCS